MISEKVQEMYDANGELASYAWPGGYPLLYLCEDNAVLCADCANGKNGSDVKVQDDPQWNVVDYMIHYEGEPEHCDHCNKEIESAYGVPDEQV